MKPTRLELREFRTEHNVALTVQQREALRRVHPGMRIEPAPYAQDRYDITPDQRIGMVAIPGMEIEIRPKIPMSSVLFLVSYATNAVSMGPLQVEYADAAEFTEIAALMFSRLVDQATHRGLLHGYRSEEEALPAPRGRILFDELIRRRLGSSPPVDVRHDVFTSDIIENRVLNAALTGLARLTFISQRAKREVSRAQRLFGGVARVGYPATSVPDVLFTRLNRHYQPAIELASLLLRSTAIDLGARGARASALLVDMNVVFEGFLRIALRRALGVTHKEFPDRAPLLYLDTSERVPLKPDLCFFQGQTVRWVGDAKYKRLPAGAYANADLYQLLAYSTALDLPGGTLVYAADEGAAAAEYVVRNAGKQLQVVALDLTAPPASLLHQVDKLAGTVRQRVAYGGAAEAHSSHSAAYRPTRRRERSGW